MLAGPPGGGELASAEQAIARAQTRDRTKPLVALGDCLDALHAASKELHRDPGNALAKRDYNFALGRAFEIVKKARLNLWTKRLTVPGAHGEYLLTHRPDPRPEWNPAWYDFTPADQSDVGGSTSPSARPAMELARRSWRSSLGT